MPRTECRGKPGRRGRCECVGKGGKQGLLRWCAVPRISRHTAVKQRVREDGESFWRPCSSHIRSSCVFKGTRRITPHSPTPLHPLVFSLRPPLAAPLSSPPPAHSMHPQQGTCLFHSKLRSPANSLPLEGDQPVPHAAQDVRNVRHVHEHRDEAHHAGVNFVGSLFLPCHFL